MSEASSRSLVVAALVLGGFGCDSGGDWRSRRSSQAAVVSDECATEIADSLDGLPKSLACAGLYRDIGKKEIAEGVREYAPAVALWSDGAEKRRWVALPEGEQIDASASGDWVFPVGTAFFKEFSVDGRRIETRTYRKAMEDRWVRTSYAWNEDETAATRSEGADLEQVQLNGSTYRIPSGRECNQCHEGRQDRILGFEAVSLGLPGATGVSLAQLVEEERLTPAPERTELEIGDDGSGKAVEALGWMHINCGVSCHNDNSNSEAYSTRLRLRLDPEQLDGRSSRRFPTLETTIGVHGKNVRWQNDVRIVPGAPEASLLYRLVNSRAGKNDQMPPVGSRVIDQEHVRTLEAWILALGDLDREQTAEAPPRQAESADASASEAAQPDAAPDDSERRPGRPEEPAPDRRAEDELDAGVDVGSARDEADSTPADEEGGDQDDDTESCEDAGVPATNTAE